MSFDVNREIQIIARTGKKEYGIKQAIKAVKLGKAKLVVLAANCIPEERKQIEHYCSYANIPIVNYEGTGYELGALCGRGHVVNAISIDDTGDSKILKQLRKRNR
jgi:large subunit ribosomal protein L30e